jgi:hypothetical protein
MPKATFDPETGACRIVFRLPAEAGASQAWLAGEFNDWSTDALPLELQPDGSLAVETVLEPGRTYRFRYYLGNGRWDNDWDADAYVGNEFGGADSVVVVPPAPGPTDSPPTPGADGSTADQRVDGNGNGSAPRRTAPTSGRGEAAARVTEA